MSKIGDLITYLYSNSAEKETLSSLGSAPCQPYPISDPPLPPLQARAPSVPPAAMPCDMNLVFSI